VWRRYLGEVGKFYHTLWLIYPRHYVSNQLLSIACCCFICSAQLVIPCKLRNRNDWFYYYYYYYYYYYQNRSSTVDVTTKNFGVFLCATVYNVADGGVVARTTTGCSRACLLSWQMMRRRTQHGAISRCSSKSSVRFHRHSLSRARTGSLRYAACLYVSLCVCMSLCVSVCLSVSVCTSLCLSVWWSHIVPQRILYIFTDTR